MKIIKFLFFWILFPVILGYIGCKLFKVNVSIIEIFIFWIIILYPILYIKYKIKFEKEKKEKREKQLKDQIKNKIIKQIKIRDKYNNKDYLILTDKNEFFILKDNNDTLKAFDIKDYDYSIKNITKEIDTKLVQIPSGYDISNQEIYQWKFYLKNGNKLVYQIDYETHNKLEEIFLEYFSKNT